PKSVLDVGCGFGKYGVLLREYLDVWHERLAAKDWQLELVGIEAYEGYRNPVHDSVYSKVHCGEAQRVLPKLGEFDVTLIADVIEHLQKDDAREMVKECLQRHSPVVIVSTPISFYPQGAILGNPYEVHRNHWSLEDFPSEVTVRTIRI